MDTEKELLLHIEEKHPSWIVSSHDSFWMVTLSTLIGPVCLLFREALKKSFPNFSKHSHGSFLIDCLSLPGPIILSFTIFSNYMIPLYVTLLLSSFILLHISEKEYDISVERSFPLRDNGLPFLNSYRALVNLCTVIVILAVDFPQIFPQAFHKRYTKGYSLMDTGVGSFIFSHALVEPEARNRHNSISMLQRIKGCLVSSSMLIILGCTRLLVTWMTNYSVSDEEYGKHWNFFFTLAFVKLVITIIFSVTPKVIMRYPWIMALIIGVSYQVLLIIGEYKDWIIIGDNKDCLYTGGFINANRPGLFSTFGYCSLYLFGVQIGKLIFMERESWGDQLKFSVNLCAIVVISGFLTCFSNSYVDNSSRMIANLTFILWQVMHNSSLLFGSHLADMICAIFSKRDSPLIPGQCQYCTDRKSTPHCSCLLSAINKNQLFFFLIGNVLTGLVNLTVKTGSASLCFALFTISIYGIVVNGVTVIIFVCNVSTKFW